MICSLGAPSRCTVARIDYLGSFLLPLAVVQFLYLAQQSRVHTHDTQPSDDLSSHCRVSSLRTSGASEEIHQHPLLSRTALVLLWSEVR